MQRRLALLFSVLIAASTTLLACDNDELLSSIELGDIPELEACIRRGVDINEIDPEGYSPLFFAIDAMDPEVIEIVLNAGADTSYVEPEYEMPMVSLAASLGEPDVVELLIDAGADVNAKDKFGGTAIEEAAYGGFREIVVLLAKAGARTEYKLHVAAGLGEMKQIQKLISKIPADETSAIDQATAGWNRTPLHFAAAAGQVEAAAALMEAGANPNAKTVDGRSVLHMAANSGNVKLVEQLLQSGADPKIRDKNGRKPGQFSNNTKIKALLRGK